MIEDSLINTLVGSGVTGIALYMFYNLMRTEMRDLKKAIDKLADKIDG